MLPCFSSEFWDHWLVHEAEQIEFVVLAIDYQYALLQCAYMHGAKSDKTTKKSAFDRQYTASITLLALSEFCHGILSLILKTDICHNKEARAVTCSSVSR
jgi:hypothetical protein